jgi:hypothetical protein
MTTGPAFIPAVIKGMKIHPEDPLLLDFIVDNGQTGLQGQALTEETTRLVKYFLSGLALSQKDIWVNLSPAEKDRIMPEPLSHTDAGRDMLAMDFILKQITASLIYPEKELGRHFWNEIYKRAYDELGHTDIPTEAFDKVWIMPSDAAVYQDEHTAFIARAHLQVMLDSDYAAMRNAAGSEPSVNPALQDKSKLELTKAVMRQVILPVLEKEINEGKSFAVLRQMFYSMILAGWYKNILKDSFLSQVYADTGKISGITISETGLKEKVYRLYMEAYQKGVFNYVKEDFDRNAGQQIPRKYFSGGISGLAGLPQVLPVKNVVLGQVSSGDLSTISYRLAPAALNSSDNAQTDDDTKQIRLLRNQLYPRNEDINRAFIPTGNQDFNPFMRLGYDSTANRMGWGPLALKQLLNNTSFPDPAIKAKLGVSLSEIHGMPVAELEQRPDKALNLFPLGLMGIPSEQKHLLRVEVTRRPA